MANFLHGALGDHTSTVVGAFAPLASHAPASTQLYALGNGIKTHDDEKYLQ